MEKKVSISYDKEADVLYMSFGEPEKAEGEEIEEGVFARYASSGKLNGLTVINFSKKFGTSSREIKVPESI